MGRSNFITVADVKSGYWQVPVRREDQWLTGFTTHRWAFEFVRAPFGLKNSGSTFVRAVELILGPIKNFTDSYVDDMAVHSDTLELHVKHLK